ncbi:MAG: hypothetical protein K2Y71_28930 [Xanthobacteraceae bacterium]|nr:hypothetical protein [Xanthobacteraceae bacterium]
MALGALVGAVGVFFLTMEREEKARTMLATPVTVAPVPDKPAQIAMPGQPPRPQIQQAQASQNQAPKPQTAQVRAPQTQSPRPQAPATYTWAPVRFLPESIALPAAAPRPSEVMPPLRSTIATGPAPEPASTVGASPAASEATMVPPGAPAAKAVAKPKKKIVREPPPEPEPRASFAGPLFPFGLPIFGFGWQR